MLALFPREELAKDATVPSKGSGFAGFTLAYNAKSEVEVDEIIRDLKARGVKILKEPQKVFWGGYSSYFADPDGFRWEVAYNPHPIGGVTLPNPVILSSCGRRGPKTSPLPSR